MGKDLKYYVQAIGISMVWNAYPIVTFLRDGIKIAPQGSTSTVGFWVIGLLLIMPFNIFKRIYLPNRILLFVFASFVVLSYVYMLYYPSLVYDYRSAYTREILTYLFPVIFLLGISYFPNNKTDILLQVTAVFTLLGSVGLLYVLLRDPTWHIGHRAAIKLGVYHSEHAGNPHTFANNALQCVIASAICAYRSRNLALKFFYVCSTIFSIVILLMTRTTTSIVALALAAGLYTLFHSQRVLPALLSYKSILISSALATIGIAIISRYSSIITLYQSVWDMVYRRLVNTIYTASDIRVGNQEYNATIDYSSANRVISFRYFTDIFLEGDLKTVLLGEGYKSTYLDVPVLEALINQGIFGGLFFATFIGLWAFFCLKEIVQPTTSWNSFLAYASFTFFVGFVSGGRPIEAGNWMACIVFIRFLGANYSDVKSIQQV